MKRKRIIACLLVISIVALIGHFYMESALASLLVSQIQFHTGVQMEYQDIDISLVPGWITITEPRFWIGKDRNQGFLGGSQLLKLDFDLLKTIRGQTQLDHFYSNRLRLDLRSNKERTNWSRVIAQAVGQAPKPATGKADIKTGTATASKTSKAATAAVKPSTHTILVPPAPQEQFQIPSIEIRNAQLNYHQAKDGETRVYGISIDRLSYDPKHQHIILNQANITQSQRPDSLFSARQLMFSELKEADSTLLQIEGSGLVLDSRKIGERRFDFNQVIEIWIGVYKILTNDLGIKPSSKPIRIALGRLSLSDITINVQPEVGTLESPGAVQLVGNDIQFSRKNDDLVLKEIQLHEAGKSALGFQRLIFQGVSQGMMHLSQVRLEGLRLEVREDVNRSINIQRAIEIIRAMVRSLIPQEEQTASLPQPKTGGGTDMNIQDVEIAFVPMERPQETLQIENVSLDADTADGEISNITIKKNDKELLHAPSIRGRAVNGNDWRYWDLVTIPKARTNFAIQRSGWEIIQSVSNWIHIGKQIARGIRPETPSTQKAWVFQSIKIDDMAATLHETRTIQPVSWQFQPVNATIKRLQFEHPQPTATDFSLLATLKTPSAGSLSLQGKVMPPFREVNLNATMAIQIADLTRFRTYFEESMPVGIEKGGLRIHGPVKIENDRFDTTFDLYLDQPQFKSVQTKMTANVDSRTAVTALNGLKDSKGVITFRNNRLEGNIKDPKFSFGLSVSEILAKNIWNRTTQILKLPLNVVETGANMIGGLFKALIGN